MRLLGLPQRALGDYGSWLGRHPYKVFSVTVFVYSLLCLGWIHIGYKGRNSLDKREAEVMWGVSGSEYEPQLKAALDKWKFATQKAWGTDVHLNLMMGKGERYGTDILKRDVIAEAWTLFKKYFDIEVTTSSGKTYTSHDLCARGSMPDDPSNPVKFPCLMISVFDCFREWEEALDPIYARDFDRASADDIAHYHTRPSLNTVTDAEVKKLNSGGCEWWIPGVKWATESYLGGRKWNGDDLTFASSSIALFFTEGPRRAAFRLSLTNPELACEWEIEEAVQLQSREWSDMVDRFNEKSKLVEVAQVRAGAIKDLEDLHTRPPWFLMISGSIALYLYLCFSLASWHAPLQSRVNLGVQGLGVAGFATLAAGGLYMMLGKRLNPPILAGVPFLALGLGVNDMLILSRGFSELGLEFIKEKSNSDIIGAVLSRAGVGVTLTSLCNVLSFGMATSLPIIAMQDFCLCVALDSTTNYIAMMTMFPCCLMLEAYRIRKRLPDPSICTVACHRRVLEGGQDATGPASYIEELFLDFLGDKVAPRLGSWTGGIISFIVCLVAIGASVPLIVNQQVGFIVHELIPPELSMHRAMKFYFEDFSLFPSYMVYHGVKKPLDVPNNQAEMMKIYDAVCDTKFTAAGIGHYLTSFYDHVAGVENSSLIPAPAGVPQGFADKGIVRPDRFFELFNNWRKFPLLDPRSAFNDSTFLSADFAAANEFKYNEDGSIDLSFTMFYITGAQSDEEIISSIKETRAIVDASPLKGQVFVYGDIYTYWALFIELPAILWRILGIIICMVFLSSLILLQSAISATIAAVMSMLIVITTYAICVTFLK